MDVQNGWNTERMLLSRWTQVGQGPRLSQNHWKRAKLSLYASGSERQRLSLVQLPVLMNDWATCAKSRNCSFLPNNGYSLRLLCRLTPPPVQSIINMLRFLVGFAVVIRQHTLRLTPALPCVHVVCCAFSVPVLSSAPHSPQSGSQTVNCRTQ